MPTEPADAPSAAPGPASLLPTLFACALLGALFGGLYPAWQVALEPAQVLAGLVVYPADNAFGLYEQRLWTVWHQALAPLLAAGVEERTLAIGISLLLGALCFGALGVFALALGAPPLLAVATPVFTWALNPWSWGWSYPILLLGYPHTYGIAGIAWVLLATGLLGAGRLRAGALLLGFAPAVHASLGAWVALVAGIAGLASWRALRPHLGPVLLFGSIGAALAAASLVLHLVGQPPLPQAVEPAEASRHLEVFLRVWDAHRAPPELLRWRTLLLALGVGLAIALLRRAARAPEVGRALLLRVYLGCACLGFGFSLLRAWLPTDAIPTALLVSMPTRLANIPMLAFVALLAGSIGALRPDPRWRLLAAVLAIVALGWFRLHALLDWGLPALTLVTGALLLLRPASAEPTGLAVWTRRHARLLDRGLVSAVCIAVALIVASSVRDHPRRMAKLRDRTADPVYAAAAAGEGLLLVAPPAPLAQLLTRRPLLLDPNALDMLPYAPAAGPAMARILGEVYGVDFFAPPVQIRNRSELPMALVQPVWEARASAEWSALAARFGFTDLLVPATWRLALPEVARGPRLALYRVPSAGAAPSGSRAKPSGTEAGPSGSQ